MLDPRHMRALITKKFEDRGLVSIHGLGIMRTCTLFGPDANRLVLHDKERRFSARRPWTQIMGHVFPNGLLLRDGEDHKHHRKIMLQAFKQPVLKAYLDRMNPKIAEGIEAWDQTGANGRGEIHTSDGQLLAFSAIKKLTLDIATSIFIGTESGPEADQMNKAFIDMVGSSMSILRVPIPGLTYTRGINGRKFMIGYLKKMMERKRASQETDTFSRLCHAESEEGGTFSDSEVIDHMIFLMMAAHDTTTSTMSSMIYRLAKHPEWQDRLREESRALGAEHAGFDDLDNFEQHTMVLREALRMYPPLPAIIRETNVEIEYGGYRIPPKTMVSIYPIHTHYMPEWWTDPEIWDPERFSPERAEHERHTHSFIPFGGGPHLCIGYRFAETQIRAIMHQLVLRYRWSIPEGYEMPVLEAPISKPLDGLPIRLERIN